jgi:hypothetical protein
MQAKTKSIAAVMISIACTVSAILSNTIISVSIHTRFKRSVKEDRSEFDLDQKRQCGYPSNLKKWHEEVIEKNNLDSTEIRTEMS